jgi:hypothetical protein
MGDSMINISFIGNIFHEDGTPALNVRYQGLFIKTNPNSSPSKWDIVRAPETNQYNLNLGDNSWLSQQAGYAAPGDKVLLCFWAPNDKSRDELGLTEWCFIEWVLDSRDVYVQNIQLRGAINPNCIFDINPNSVGHVVSIEDMGSNDYHMWVYDGKEHYQSHFWDVFQIYNMNKFPDFPVSINWGDGNIETFPLSASPFPHIYGIAGNYIVSVELTNASGLKCQSIFTTAVPYEVFNGLLWDDPATLSIPEMYTPSISGDLARIQGVNYYIDGVLTHIDFAYNTEFEHTFTEPGNHVIRQCIKFNDGFANQVQCKDFIIELDTVANYTSSDYDCGLVFSDITTAGRPPITRYQWDVMEGAFILAHVEGTNYQDWYYSWPYKGTFRVRMAITDSNDRTSSITKEYIVDNCPGAGSGGGSGGGSPWVYAETKYIKTNEPICSITITSIDGIDKDEQDKKILILEIID